MWAEAGETADVAEWWTDLWAGEHRTKKRTLVYPEAFMNLGREIVIIDSVEQHRQLDDGVAGGAVHGVATSCKQRTHVGSRNGHLDKVQLGEECKWPYHG